MQIGSDMQIDIQCITPFVTAWCFCFSLINFPASNFSLIRFPVLLISLNTLQITSCLWAIRDSLKLYHQMRRYWWTPCPRICVPTSPFKFTSTPSARSSCSRTVIRVSCWTWSSNWSPSCTFQETMCVGRYVICQTKISKPSFSRTVIRVSCWTWSSNWSLSCTFQETKSVGRYVICQTKITKPSFSRTVIRASS